MIQRSGLRYLGYDPQPGIDRWRGTSIPPLDEPLARTPDRWRIAGYVWWHGPPWTVLRNASHYLWHVMDYARTDDLRSMLQDIPEELWRRALDDARPGQLSKGSFVFWSLVFERPLTHPCPWPDDAHRLDHRPLAGVDRERLFERHALGRQERQPLQGHGSTSFTRCRAQHEP